MVACVASRRCIDETVSRAEHGLVREHRAKPVQADGPRAADDADRDGAVRRELDAVLVGHAREELRRLRASGRRERGRASESGESRGDGEAKHGSARVADSNEPICRSYSFRTACASAVAAPRSSSAVSGEPVRRSSARRGRHRGRRATVPMQRRDVLDRHRLETPASRSSHVQAGVIRQAVRRIESSRGAGTTRFMPAARAPAADRRRP